jgi:hypothetical protein
MVTVHPASPEDFLDYNKLMNYLYRPLAGIVKKNHIFSCMDDGLQMRLRQSNLEEHNLLNLSSIFVVDVKVVLYL